MTSFDQQKTSREEIQMLTFSLDNVSYGVNVHQVREVKNFEGVTPVPYAPPYVKGVTNLRGEVIPVIDLRKRFGMEPKKGNEDNGIMVIVQDKHPIGVMVDSVMEVLTLPKNDIESNHSNLINDSSQAVLGVAKHDKDLIILLDLMKVVSKGDIQNVKDTTKGFQIQTQKENEDLTKEQ
ncbi:MAG: chemotaxis protein CheW [Candidatus Bathyarchaeota archaeon]|nr:chemotaxis protein CheW [Candidatus Bathyarchaeota archaeon]